MDHKSELKNRFIAKQKQLEAKIAQLQANAHGSAREEIEKIEKSLAMAKENIKDGWENLRDEAAKKINQWLKE